MTTKKNQCDSCAFKISESQASPNDDTAVENKYKTLRNLKNSPKKDRAIYVSIGIEKTEETDKTETCFINSPLWPEDAKTIYCPDRVEDCLSIETALSLRSSYEANRIAKEAIDIARREASSACSSARWAMWSAIIATITAIIIVNEQINSTISILIK